MKICGRFLVFSLAFWITLSLFSCGSDDPVVFVPEANSNLPPVLSADQFTPEDRAHIFDTMVAAMNSSVALRSGATTALTENFDYSIPCLVGGEIFFSGFIDTQLDPFFLVGQLSLIFGDLQNFPQNACEIEDNILLDGLLTLDLSANQADRLQVTLVGNLSVHRRTQFGGFFPISPVCSIFIEFTSGDGQLPSGNVCGEEF
jgi:hypothetical protein